MRESEFPFATYRDWGVTPESKPEIDTVALLDIAHWQQTKFKKPMRDEITGYYGFFPSVNGVNSYIQGRIRKHPAQHKPGEFVEEYLERKERQPLHIAEHAELATALFSTAAYMRSEVLRQALSYASDTKEMPDDIAKYASDAIADYGYCLEYPVDIDHLGVDHGKGLKSEIERIGQGAAKELLDFGNYANDNPEQLHTLDGVTAMEITLAEQKRRIDFWDPRHKAVLELYPNIEVSEEILLQRLPLHEMLDITMNLNSVEDI